MNFAYGGTGVTETLAAYPNMTAQIGLFEQLIEDNTFSGADVNSSMTLVTLSGNDYSAYLARNGSFGVRDKYKCLTERSPLTSILLTELISILS